MYLIQSENGIPGDNPFFPTFKKSGIRKGILGSPWVGFQCFTDFFSSRCFWRLLRNTLVISATSLAFAFPILCPYPFLRRFFVKGVMAGALRG